MHKLDFVHRDLKPENFVVLYVDDKMFFKLTDFGLSKNIGQLKTKGIWLQKSWIKNKSLYPMELRLIFGRWGASFTR